MRTNGQTRTYSNSNGNHTKSPAEIERQIEMTRARMSNTIEAIRRDLSPGQVIDHALHYFKDGKVGETAGNMASSVASSVGGVVKTNPLPAAMVGAGLAWLVVSNSKAKRAERSYAEVKPSYATDSLPGIDTTSSYYTTEFPTSLSVPEEEHGRLGSAKERLGEMKSGVKERAQHLSHGAADKARSAGVKAQATARRAKEGTVRGYEAQPLVIGAIAVGVGALLGSLLPTTARENQVMGKKRDDLMKKADEVSASLLGKAKDKVDSGVQMVKEKLEQSSGMLQGEKGDSSASTFESDLAPDIEPYSVMASTSTSVIQTAPLPVPEEIFQGSTSGSFGGGFEQSSSAANEREIEGMEPASTPPKNRGPGI